MPNFYSFIRHGHDPAALLIALLVCSFGSIIAISIGQRALTFSGKNVAAGCGQQGSQQA